MPYLSSVASVCPAVVSDTRKYSHHWSRGWAKQPLSLITLEKEADCENKTRESGLGQVPLVAPQELLLETLTFGGSQGVPVAETLESVAGRLGR